MKTISANPNLIHPFEHRLPAECQYLKCIRTGNYQNGEQINCKKKIFVIKLVIT